MSHVAGSVATVLLCLAVSGALAACAVSDPPGGIPQPTPGGGSASASPQGTPAATSSSAATQSVSPSSSPRGRIVFDGDSLTYGFMVQPSESYPAQAMRVLPNSIRWDNVAVSGQTWPDLLADVTSEVDPQYSPANSLNIVVVWCGTNDLAAGFTAQQMFENARTYCAGRRAAGFTVLLCTVYPLEPKDYEPSYEQLRLAYNQLLRDHWREFADGLVDLAADSRIGDNSPDSRGSYFIDIVHLNATGYAVIADAVLASLRPFIDVR